MSSPKPPPRDFLTKLGMIPLQEDVAVDAVLDVASPILRHRIKMLGSGNDWLHSLTWSKTDETPLLMMLREAQGIHSEVFLGYRCCDMETYLAVIEVQLLPTSSKNTLYMNLALCVDDISFELQWRLQELTTCLSKEAKLFSSLEAAKTALEVELSKTRAPGSEEVGSDDDYWGQYDAQESDKEETSQVAATNDEDYYSRYETEVDTAIVSQDPAVKYDDPLASHNPLEKHVRQSIHSLRQLCHASGMEDRVFRNLVEQVLDQDSVQS